MKISKMDQEKTMFAIFVVVSIIITVVMLMTLNRPILKESLIDNHNDSLVIDNKMLWPNNEKPSNVIPY